MPFLRGSTKRTVVRNVLGAICLITEDLMYLRSTFFKKESILSNFNKRDTRYSKWTGCGMKNTLDSIKKKFSSMTRNCKQCGVAFEITKFQSKKWYCCDLHQRLSTDTYQKRKQGGKSKLYSLSEQPNDCTPYPTTE